MDQASNIANSTDDLTQDYPCGGLAINQAVRQAMRLHTLSAALVAVGKLVDNNMLVPDDDVTHRDIDLGSLFRCFGSQLGSEALHLPTGNSWDDLLDDPTGCQRPN